MQIKIRKRLKSSYLRSVSVLMTGTLAAQVLAFAVSPLMTRLFSEDAIGQYTLLLTVSSMFGAVICGRYDMAIVTEPDFKKSLSVIKLCFICTLFLSMLLSAGYTYSVYNSEKIEINYICFFICSFLLLVLTGVGNIGSAYNNKNKEYKLLAKINIIRELGRDIVLILTGLFHFEAIGLIISQFASIGLCINKQYEKLRVYFKQIWAIERHEILEAAKKYKNQPLYSVPSLFLNNFSYSALNVIVASLFGVGILAYYSMSFRVLGLPIMLLSTNVSRVFFERASELHGKSNRFVSLYLKTSLLLFALSLPIMLVLYLFAPILFDLLFGDSWRMAGEMVVILLPMFSVRLVVGALTPVMIVLNKQKIEMFVQTLFLCVTILSYYMFRDSTDIFDFITFVNWSYFVIYVLYYVLMLFYCITAKREL